MIPSATGMYHLTTKSSWHSAWSKSGVTRNTTTSNIMMAYLGDTLMTMKAAVTRTATKTMMMTTMATMATYLKLVRSSAGWTS